VETGEGGAKWRVRGCSHTKRSSRHLGQNLLQCAFEVGTAHSQAERRTATRHRHTPTYFARSHEPHRQHAHCRRGEPNGCVTRATAT